MKRKTKLVSILLALLIVTLLVSCIPKKSETDSSSDRPRESDGNIVEKVTDDDTSDDTSEVPKLTYWMELESANILTSHDEKMCYQEIQEKLGIDIEWIHPAQGQAEEQFNLLIVSDELPDLIHYNWLNYPGGPEAAMEGKLIIKLNEYIEEKSPNLKGYLEKFPEVDMMIKTDTGTYYSYPYIYTSTPPESKDYKQASERIPAYETY